MNLQRLVLHNFWLKTVSILLATFLWLVVHADLKEGRREERRFGQVNVEREFTNCPVLVLTEFTGRIGYVTEPREVSIRISGPAPLVDLLQAGEVRAFVRVSATHPPRQPTATPVEPLAPRGVTATRVAPDLVTIKPVDSP